ncbi:hypothetical protein OG883_36290 [Streptomyces sp. NBC_01142]|uniref:hypothetical protein n=1 Tax=Streptomyces sp. NBC_01142 TaxID=2975865 RepID=UPI00224D63A3|nr:hypothetical protein [Streptomyces sp. NBC_01142]MCX4825226.1 hypothetical protein [Streptomyces sp. NBC_01142]
MGKKQSRQNRGARTGGHERSVAAEAKDQAKTPAAQETAHTISEPVSRKERKFGHN